MAKREKRPYLVERLNECGIWCPWIENPLDDVEWDSTATALKTIKDAKQAGDYRVVLLCAKVRLITEAAVRVQMTEM